MQLYYQVRLNAMSEQQINEYADFFKAVGNPTRLKLVLLLEHGEQCVCDLEEKLHLDMSVISRHLKQLKSCAIVSSRREGKKVFYKLEMPCIPSFLQCIAKAKSI